MSIFISKPQNIYHIPYYKHTSLKYILFNNGLFFTIHIIIRYNNYTTVFLIIELFLFYKIIYKINNIILRIKYIYKAIQQLILTYSVFRFKTNSYKILPVDN